MYGLTFYEKDEDIIVAKGMHTYTTFGLKMTYFNPGQPEEKREVVDIPYSNKQLDFTDMYNGPHYNTRKLVAEFRAEDKDYEKWAILESRILNILHGKIKKIVPDIDRSHYYIGRCSCAMDKKNKFGSSVTIQCTAEPFKYDVTSSTEPWLWDTYSFVDGVIQDYSAITISGSSSITIPSGKMSTVPILRLITGSVNVIYEGRTYRLNQGENRIPEIRVGAAYNATLAFTGTGKISIEYRGGSL